MVTGPPIFIVGSPRTGTTLMKDILNRHPDIHIFNEVHFFERIWDQRGELGDLAEPPQVDRVVEQLLDVVTRWGDDQEVAGLLAPPAFQKAAAAEGGGYPGILAALLKAGAQREGASRWGDSSPQDVLYLETILDWYPEARIVAMARDPRAFLASYKNYHRRAEGDYTERYSALTNSLLWRSYMAALLEARSSSWGDAVLALRYEDLVTEPEARIRQICDHVGVEFHNDLLGVRAANSSYAPGDQASGIFVSSIDRWREELSATELWLVERVCGPVMEALGYTRSTGVRPDWIELAQILAVAPARLFNMLFRGAKEFRLAKLRRILGLLRGT